MVGDLSHRHHNATADTKNKAQHTKTSRHIYAFSPKIQSSCGCKTKSQINIPQKCHQTVPFKEDKGWVTNHSPGDPGGDAASLDPVRGTYTHCAFNFVSLKLAQNKTLEHLGGLFTGTPHSSGPAPSLLPQRTQTLWGPSVSPPSDSTSAAHRWYQVGRQTQWRI